MNYQLLRTKMQRFFETTSTEALINKFEQLGYVFEKYNLEKRILKDDLVNSNLIKDKMSVNQHHSQLKKESYNCKAVLSHKNDSDFFESFFFSNLAT